MGRRRNDRKPGFTRERRAAAFKHPLVILGLSGAYEKSWAGRTPLKTVRWFLKPFGSAASPGDPVLLPASLDEVMVETIPDYLSFLRILPENPDFFKKVLDIP